MNFPGHPLNRLFGSENSKCCQCEVDSFTLNTYTEKHKHTHAFLSFGNRASFI